MKLNRLEAHDRLEHLKENQSLNVGKGAEDCLKKNKLCLTLQEKCPYVYLFAHPRTADDGVTKKMFWQPRLTKPKAQTNSYLFRAKSNTDIMEVCWLIPPEEMWKQYQKGNVTEHELVNWSIEMYQNHRYTLEMREMDDLPDEQARKIYKQIIKEIREDRKPKPMILGASLLI